MMSLVASARGTFAVWRRSIFFWTVTTYIVVTLVALSGVMVGNVMSNVELESRQKTREAVIDQAEARLSEYEAKVKSLADSTATTSSQIDRQNELISQLRVQIQSLEADLSR